MTFFLFHSVSIKYKKKKGCRVPRGGSVGAQATLQGRRERPAEIPHRRGGHVHVRSPVGLAYMYEHMFNMDDVFFFFFTMMCGSNTYLLLHLATQAA